MERGRMEGGGEEIREGKRREGGKGEGGGGREIEDHEGDKEGGENESRGKKPLVEEVPLGELLTTKCL
jgi:hypothetical protein